MVRVASLASFPAGCISREFYAHTPLSEDDESVFVRKRRRDRARKQRKREREKESAMPEEVLALFQRNGGAE